ncbi:hypothetical protein C6Y14_03615 [Streptomyces dioscori]|uniref:Uncharacterized protein n=1 Tax=Streptomyces dioscori TaxID=2109333 RepID=A0A2P8QFZ7_9ACTN|nr:hypothetical protein [Streptomyces dioscori]PSM45175.1 hypothetical protein C6Y14_03615 [Streptomyces dioscori]
MEQSGTSTRLADAVQGLTSELVSALRSGGPFGLAGSVPGAGGPEAADKLTLAAVRVVGADAVLPNVLRHTPPEPDDLAVFSGAVHAYPPPADASPTSTWSHWAMNRTLLRLRGTPDAARPGTPGHNGSSGHSFGHSSGHDTEPRAAWLDGASWQSLTHQLAVLAPLAVPGGDCAVTRVARGRPADVARGFVRAVRRRDWLQAAGAGRWLALLDGVPDTLGLENGLAFVAQMGSADPRVLLQVEAARLMRTGAPV